AWAEWPEGKLVLVGPEGSGKSHLAQVWAAEAGAVVVAARDLGGDLPGLGVRLVVEDADRVVDEAALFHLHNLVVPGGRLLITARVPPRDWGLGLPDLVSRMQAASLVRLAAPDDALLSAVLIKLFADRQVAVQPVLIEYLVRRMGRSLGVARDLVARLDALALARGSAVTRGLASEVLDNPGAVGQDG
ncbi:MAG: chromosomal replication initiator DnaA, partial [Paracoccaceae bacterium]